VADKQVIRQDVIQVVWDVQESPLKKIASESNTLRSSVGKAVTNVGNKFTQFAKSVQKSNKQITAATSESSRVIKRMRDDIKQADAAIARLKATVAAAKANILKLKAAAANVKAQFKAMVEALKPSNVLERMRMQLERLKTAARQNVQHFKALSKQKLTSLVATTKGVVNTLTGGKRGAEGFKNTLKNIAKIGFSETVNGIKNIGTKIRSAGSSIKNFGRNLKTNVKTGFQNSTAKGKQFLSTVKRIDKSKFTQLSASLGNIARKLGTGIVTAAKKAVKALSMVAAASGVGAFKLAGMASDLSETMNKVEVSFGKDNLSAMQKWSQSSIKNMGMAQQTALDMAAGYGDMGTSMGLTQNSAMKLSQELTQRAADLASFKNMELDEVNTALNGIFTGETESLKRLGVVMTQTNLEKFAKDQGKVYDKLSESEKVMLRYQYVMKKTSNAQGDFQRTGGGFANQLRMAKEQLKQIGTTIGGVFIGGFENVLSKVNTFGTELNAKLSEVFKDGFQFGDIAKIAPMLGPVGNVLHGIADKIKAITSNKEKMGMIKGIFESIKNVAGKIGTFIGLAASKITDFVTSAGFLKTVKTIADGVSKAFGFINKHFNTILEVVIPLAAGIGAVVGVVKAISAAMKVWSAVQWLVNSGLLACPITWIVLGIGALVAVIVVLVRHWDKVKAAAVKCWEKIKSAWGGVKDWFKSNIVTPVKNFFMDLWDKLPAPVQKVVKKIYSAFQLAIDKIKSAWGGIKTWFADIWKQTVKNVATPVNKLIDGANWVLEKVGSGKKFSHWEPYARGTDGHPGGNAIVNDGRGAELVQMPNGKTFIPRGRNVLLPNAPQGMKVLSAERTAQVMGKSHPTFNYAGGIGDWDIWDFFDNVKGLASKVVEKFVSFKGMSGYALDVGKALINKAKGSLSTWIKGLFGNSGKSLGSYEPSKGVEQWRSTVVQALKMEGQHTAANVKRTLYQMQTESGGNPKAINKWDSNAKKGTPSKGLMQVIDPTFKAYARKGFNGNIYDPLSNILASVRYAVARYGSLAKAYRGVGYADGIGTVRLPAYSPAGSVPVSSSSSTSNNYAPSFTLNLSGTVDRTTERTVKKWVKEAMEDVFDSMARTNPRVTEV